MIDNIEKITETRPLTHHINICDKKSLEKVFEENRVVHLAAYKSVVQSLCYPLSYYRNNIDSTLSFLETMENFGVKNIIFSSSAAVYGTKNSPPIMRKCTPEAVQILMDGRSI